MVVAQISVGDGLAVTGLGVAVLLYALQSALARRREVLAARASLLGVRAGMLDGWGSWFFSHVYGEADAAARAMEDAELVRKERGHHQVFLVPREPLVALATSPAAGDLISDDTVESASLALYWIGVFNQLVQQETDFNALHLAEIRGEVISEPEREAVALGASRSRQ
jgi:hypothetical protein